MTMVDSQTGRSNDGPASPNVAARRVAYANYHYTRIHEKQEKFRTETREAARQRRGPSRAKAARGPPARASAGGKCGA